MSGFLSGIGSVGAIVKAVNGLLALLNKLMLVFQRKKQREGVEDDFKNPNPSEGMEDLNDRFRGNVPRNRDSDS